MLIYNSKHLYVTLLEVQYLMHFKFYESCKDFDIEKFNIEFENFNSKKVNRKGKYFLVDLTDTNKIFESEVVDEFTEKVILNVSEKIELKIAWLVNENEEFEFKNIQKAEQRIFYKPDLAIKWLLENSEKKPFSFENGNIPKHKH